LQGNPRKSHVVSLSPLSVKAMFRITCEVNYSLNSEILSQFTASIAKASRNPVSPTDTGTSETKADATRRLSRSRSKSTHRSRISRTAHSPSQSPTGVHTSSDPTTGPAVLARIDTIRPTSKLDEKVSHRKCRLNCRN